MKILPKLMGVLVVSLWPMLAQADAALDDAAAKGRVAVNKSYLDKGGDPNVFGPLQMAAFNGHSAIVSALLDAGAKPDTYSSDDTTLQFQGKRAVEIATKPSVIRLLEQAGNKP